MATQSQWIDKFPGLARLEDSVRSALVKNSRIVELPAGTVIFGPGKAPEHMLLLLEGTVRVQQISDTGREIVLYRVTAGESCVLTTACLLAYEDYLAEGLAETAVKAVAIARSTFDELIATSPVFRRFVFTAFSTRITELFQLIDAVAFSRVDIRLAQKLIQLADSKGHLATTHQALANELGTAREVISRQLHEFQRRGWIESGRNSIDVKNASALEKLAQDR